MVNPEALLSLEYRKILTFTYKNASDVIFLLTIVGMSS